MAALQQECMCCCVCALIEICKPGFRNLTMNLALCSHVIGACQPQVEFYFSDSNLPKDKFLRGQVEAHPEGCEDKMFAARFSQLFML